MSLGRYRLEDLGAVPAGLKCLPALVFPQGFINVFRGVYYETGQVLAFDDAGGRSNLPLKWPDPEAI